MVYVIIALNPTVDFVIGLCGTKITEVSFIKFDTMVIYILHTKQQKM